MVVFGQKWPGMINLVGFILSLFNKQGLTLTPFDTLNYICWFYKLLFFSQP